MEKVNYDKKFYDIVSNLSNKPNLLLHTCCGPCSSYVLELLVKYFDITVLFYNPNIYPEEEYLKRKSELLKLLGFYKEVSIIDIDYLSDEFYKVINGLENEHEGGSRCSKCFMLRLQKTRDLALKYNFEYFGTTLTVSPHKNSQIINEIGSILESDNLKFLYSDFKKNDGYKKSIENSKKYDLYRQDYCGCEFSKKERELKIKE